MKHFSICALCSFVLSAVIAAGSVSFLGACIHEDGGFGACHWAGQALFGIGLLLMAESLFALLCGDSRIRQGIYGSMLLTAILGCLIPGTLIDLCHMATMRCRALMQPAMILLCAIIGMISLIGFFLERRKAGKQV